VRRRARGPPGGAQQAATPQSHSWPTAPLLVAMAALDLSITHLPLCARLRLMVSNHLALRAATRAPHCPAPTDRSTRRILITVSVLRGEAQSQLGVGAWRRCSSRSLSWPMALPIVTGQRGPSSGQPTLHQPPGEQHGATPALVHAYPTAESLANQAPPPSVAADHSFLLRPGPLPGRGTAVLRPPRDLLAWHSIDTRSKEVLGSRFETSA
jgi:hypothetical protein